MRPRLSDERSSRDWTEDVLCRLDRRLNAPDRGPVALALSGGGDSLALLRLARFWGERAGRPIVALTVDHGLQRESAGWARFAAERAARLGARHHTLAWTGEKPATGLPAAARRARHALLADAARQSGARVILMGHTADDVREAAEMRRAGASVPTPAEWAPSPAWPQGRGVFLFRPLLGVRRAALRALLAELGETWVEDPANDDPRFSRAQARRRLSSAPYEAPAPRVCDRRSAAALDLVSEGLGGELIAERRPLMATADAARTLSAMALCAAGGDRPPRGASLRGLMDRLAAPEPFAAGLAGARVEAAAERVMVCREAGERARGALQEAQLRTGESVFDGRFLVTSSAAPGFRIAALRGQARRLPKAERMRLARVPAGARGSLPVVISPAETLSCPILAQDGPVRARPLALERLSAALGAVADEAALWRVAKQRGGA